MALATADAVPMLTYMLVNDKDYGVRIAVANALGGVRTGGQEGVPRTSRRSRARSRPSIRTPTKDELDQEMRFARPEEGVPRRPREDRPR